MANEAMAGTDNGTVTISELINASAILSRVSMSEFRPLQLRRACTQAHRNLVIQVQSCPISLVVATRASYPRSSGVRCRDLYR